MVRFMTCVTLLTLALMTVTCLGSDIPDPADVAAEANVQYSPDPVIEANETTTDTKPPVIHNMGAISDSISKVTTETTINTPALGSASGSSHPDDSTSTPAPGTAPDASASTHVTPSIALASVAAITIINLFV